MVKNKIHIVKVWNFLNVMTHLRFAHCNLFCFSLSLLFVKAHEPIKTRATSEWFQRICSLDVLLVLRIWLTSKRKYVFVCLKCIWHCRCTIPILFYCCCFSFFSSSFPFFFWKTKDTDYNFYPIPWKPESEKCASAFKQVKNRIHKRKKCTFHACLLLTVCVCSACSLNAKTFDVLNSNGILIHLLYVYRISHRFIL